MKTQKVSPVVSVITVVFNGESYLEKTLKSVIDQTYPSIELIVVDGGSTDKTLEIIEKNKDKIRWISEKDEGIYHAMNKGISMATGEWINFLNGGDYYFDSSTLANVFEQNDLEKIDFIFGDSINVYGNSVRYIKPKSLSRASLKKYLGICHQAIFVRRHIAPLYNLDYRYKAEYNWVIDIIYSIPDVSILYLKNPIVYYLLGGYSERGMLKNLKEFVQLTRKRFGWRQLVINMPTYAIVFLRFLKYALVRPKHNEK